MVKSIIRTILVLCLIVVGFVIFGVYYTPKEIPVDKGVSAVSASTNVEEVKTRQRLAYCANVLAYATNYYLLHNEHGTAKLLTMQHARTYAALLYLNLNDFQSAIKLGKSVGNQIKAELDKDQSLLPKLVDQCVVDTKKYETLYSLGEKISQDGTHYVDFFQLLATKNQQMLGVK